MKRLIRPICWVVPIALMLLLVTATIHAQTGGYDLSWFSVDGGGQTFSTGGGYELGGATGQPDAGTLGGGSYIMIGGFWNGGTLASVPGSHRTYLPVVLR